MTDADGDTKIQTEESSDEDIIRFDIGGTEQLIIQDGELLPTTDDDINLGSSAKQFKDAYIKGTATVTELVLTTLTGTLASATITSLVATSADINGGTADNVTIGVSTASPSAVVTSLVATTADINGGTIDGATLGVSTALPSAVVTSLVATTADINGGTLTSTTSTVADGTAATPGFGFTTQPGYGLYMAGTDVMGVAASGVVTAVFTGTTTTLYTNTVPNGTGALSLGSASGYWNDINYKELTDRGCLGWFDDGVEMPDGSIVSDTEAIKRIGKHPTKNTYYGKPMLDYKSFPKVAYNKAKIKGKDLPRDNNDNPIGGDDGINMTPMFSIMLGAIKELTERVEILEAEVKKLKAHG